MPYPESREEASMSSKGLREGQLGEELVPQDNGTVTPPSKSDKSSDFVGLKLSLKN